MRSTPITVTIMKSAGSTEDEGPLFALARCPRYQPKGSYSSGKSKCSGKDVTHSTPVRGNQRLKA